MCGIHKWGNWGPEVQRLPQHCVAAFSLLPGLNTASFHSSALFPLRHWVPFPSCSFHINWKCPCVLFLSTWLCVQSWRPPGWCPVRSQRKEYIGHFSNSFRDPETGVWKDEGVNQSSQRMLSAEQEGPVNRRQTAAKALEFPLAPYSLWLCEYYFLINTKVIVLGKTAGCVLSFCRCCAPGDPRAVLRCAGQSPMSSRSRFPLNLGSMSIWFLRLVIWAVSFHLLCSNIDPFDLSS